MPRAYLILSDGTVFEGNAFGADAPSIGELVFTTNTCGYIETLTDPSYYGQIVLQTFPLIGNYGIIPEDFEGTCRVRGYVVREWCRHPSNFRSRGDVDAYLKSVGVPGIEGVDTRAITQILRDRGVMNAMIAREIPEDLEPIRRYAVVHAVDSATCGAITTLAAEGAQAHRVVLIDYGAKANIDRELQRRGCEVIAVPARTSAEDILALKPDGIMLSNGPGDPAENTACIAELQKLIGRLPMFGICLGHQLLALASGGRTYKLKYGHRGANQPVKDLDSGRTLVTTQNHGYAVDGDHLPSGRVRFINANDLTCEGVDYPEHRAFTVQFHPEACAGPHDTETLFDRFIAMMGGC